MKINIPDFADKVKAICIFHSADMDGKTAGFCVNLYQRLANIDYEETDTYCYFEYCDARQPAAEHGAGSGE